MDHAFTLSASRLVRRSSESGVHPKDSSARREAWLEGMNTLLRNGTHFANRYRIVGSIAAGGMGAIYEVEHLETDRRLALKVMLPHTLQSENLRERFRAEAKVAARIRSEHVVDVLDAGVDEATAMPFLVMELLAGEDLGAHLGRVGRLSAGDVVEYLSQVALGLDRMHAASVIHRDLKPENLFLARREDGSIQVKILDFGVAKVIAAGAAATKGTHAQGTPLYMAPEQFAAGREVSPATDVFALGMIVYLLLVGEAYWAPELGGGMNIFVLSRLAEAGPQEAASVRAASRGVVLPPAFNTWFTRATAPDPAARFASATAAAVALGEALGVSARRQVVLHASEPFGADLEDSTIPSTLAAFPSTQKVTLRSAQRVTFPAADVACLPERSWLETLPSGAAEIVARPRLPSPKRLGVLGAATVVGAALALLSVGGWGTPGGAGPAHLSAAGPAFLLAAGPVRVAEPAPVAASAAQTAAAPVAAATGVAAPHASGAWARPSGKIGASRPIARPVVGAPAKSPTAATARRRYTRD